MGNRDDHQPSGTVKRRIGQGRGDHGVHVAGMRGARTNAHAPCAVERENDARSTLAGVPPAQCPIPHAIHIATDDSHQRDSPARDRCLPGIVDPGVREGMGGRRELGTASVRPDSRPPPGRAKLVTFPSMCKRKCESSCGPSAARGVPQRWQARVAPADLRPPAQRDGHSPRKRISREPRQETRQAGG